MQINYCLNVPQAQIYNSRVTKIKTKIFNRPQRAKRRNNMKNHKYLSLNIGAITQYSMIINKKDIVKYKTLGWKEFVEVGLPKGDEKADLLYGKMSEQETLMFNVPIFLKDIDESQITGRKIIGFSCNLGTYGMGGAGFFGLLLDNSEYLVYAVWRAGRYVIVDNKIVECASMLYGKMKPFVSNFGENSAWDDLTKYIKGAVIQHCELTENHCKIIANKNEKTIEIEFVKNDKRIPRKAGRAKNAYKQGTISDYIIFQNKNAVLIV
jgi:hypothetical protein